MKRFAAFLLSLVATCACAQSWPTKPIRIIVPYPAGGTSDILARALSPGLQAALGQPIVVENKAGATGNLGADYVAKSAPDGHTLLLADIGSLAISPSVFSTLPFDPVRDFAPVIMVAYSPHLLVVHPSVPAKDARALVALAKAKPNSFNFAVSGIGGANHTALMICLKAAGVDYKRLKTVVFAGGAASTLALLGGHVDAIHTAPGDMAEHLKAGKLRTLAISSPKRIGGAFLGRFIPFITRAISSTAAVPPAPSLAPTKSGMSFVS